MVLELTGFRNYQQNVSKRNKTLERLSSGYRINRSADDAAGLAVAEKLQLQVSGTEQAGSNVKDAISLVQTGEAAMQEIHDMLGRLYTLAEQSSNGTYENEVDRENLQKEVSQLKSEIDRISESANYNGIPLLSGGTGVDGVDWSGEVAQVHQTVSNLTGQTAKNAAVASWEGDVDLSKAVDGSYVDVNGVRFEFWTDPSQFTPNGNNVLVNVSSSDTMANKANALKNAISSEISKVNANVNNASSGLCGLDPSVSINNDGSELTIVQSTNDRKNPADSNSEWNDRNIEVKSGSVIHNYTCTGQLISKDRYNETVNINLNYITEGATITLFGNTYTIKIDQQGKPWQDGDTEVVISYDNSDPTNQKRVDLEERIKEIGQNLGAVDVDWVSFTGDDNTKQILSIKYDTKYPKAARKNNDVVIKNNPDGLPSTPKSVTPTTKDVAAQTASRTEQIDFSKLRQGDSITVNGKQYAFAVDSAANAEEIANAFVSAFKADPPDNPQDLKASAVAAPDPIYQISFVADTPADGDKIDVTYATKQEAAAEIPCNTFIFQIGASSEEKLELTIQNVSVRYLGISGVDVSAQEEASDSMDRIKKAVDQLSDNRGVLGAAQNRLEHTENHLGVTGENLTNALSTIKDASMAKEVMAHTKNQILAESTQSMMAQSENLTRQRVQFFADL